ncbi:pterin 4 alpha carbinolamine dehydratase-domain-containing protein [Neurospora tetraspora]|uniref:4a-hydroxytetrahydrobiopterin dehydratase n=1 Tax=Neurospora tetraspora TaxID=94610 RepID=A0AAE0J9C9_9PEZI|nr:pterin 4 alpha carbinolamine dehydratase-domain-containing protein [Neurospora tetraspora]
MSFTFTRTTKTRTLLTKLNPNYRTLAENNSLTRKFSIFIQNRSTPKTTTYSQQQSPPQTIILNQQKSRTMSSSSSEIKPQFSEGSEPAVLGPALDKLLATSGAGGRWTLTQEGVAIERTFKFKTFAKTWDFMTAVSLQCKLKNHHPEWSNVFNTTFIRWTTHVPKGLSSKDIELATICDSLAKDFGETEPEAGASCAMPNLTDRAVASSGDCCTPKHLKK